MCATAITAQRWKRLFLGLEAFVIFAFLYGIALKITWGYDVAGHPYLMAVYQYLSLILRPMLRAFLLVVPFLLLVPPFFLRSLRASALRAWLFGIAGLLYLVAVIFVER